MVLMEKTKFSKNCFQFQNTIKLKIAEKYAIWKQKNERLFDLADLWYYVKKNSTHSVNSKIKTPVVFVVFEPLEKIKLVYKRFHMKICTVMKTKLNYNGYNLIANEKNAAKIWKIIWKNHRPKNSGILNNIFQNLNAIFLFSATSTILNKSTRTKIFQRIPKHVETFLFRRQFFFVHRFHFCLRTQYNS